MELILVPGDHQRKLVLYIFTDSVQESSQQIGTKSAFKKKKQKKTPLIQGFVAVSLIAFYFLLSNAVLWEWNIESIKMEMFCWPLVFPTPKIAWALNKGIKPDYKQYWDVELGVTYIPWDKVKPEDLESFCEGGMLDNETLSPGTVLLHVLLLNLYFRVWPFCPVSWGLMYLCSNCSISSCWTHRNQLCVLNKM